MSRPAVVWFARKSPRDHTVVTLIPGGVSVVGTCIGDGGADVTWTSSAIPVSAGARTSLPRLQGTSGRAKPEFGCCSDGCAAHLRQSLSSKGGPSPHVGEGLRSPELAVEELDYRSLHYFAHRVSG